MKGPLGSVFIKQGFLLHGVQAKPKGNLRGALFGETNRGAPVTPSDPQERERGRERGRERESPETSEQGT